MGRETTNTEGAILSARVGPEQVEPLNGGRGLSPEGPARAEDIRVIWTNDPGGTKILAIRHPPCRVDTVVSTEWLFDEGKLSELVGVGLARIRQVALERGMNAVIAPELSFDLGDEPGEFTVFVQACPCWVEDAPSA